MGWWKSEHGNIGDEPADAMDALIRTVSDIYRKEDLTLTQGQFADLVEFCTGGKLRCVCRDPHGSLDDEADAAFKQLFPRVGFPT